MCMNKEKLKVFFLNKTYKHDQIVHLSNLLVWYPLTKLYGLDWPPEELPKGSQAVQVSVQHGF